MSDTNRKNVAKKKPITTTWQPTRAGAASKSKASGSTNSAPAARVRVATTSAQNWKTIFTLHRRVAREALQKMLATPLACLATVIMLGITLSFPMLLAMGLKHLASLQQNTGAATNIALYLSQQTSDDQAQKLLGQVRQVRGVKHVTYISAEEGLKEFEQYSGLGQALTLLGHNPLPAVLEVEPHDSETLAVTNLRNRLRRLEGVERVRVDDEWLKRLNGIVALGNRILASLSVLIVAAVLLTIGNTIRLMVLNCREEILIVKLVGGSDNYVMLPFLYTGIWYGLFSGGAAWLVSVGMWLFLSEPASQLASFYQEPFVLSFPDWATSATVLLAGALAGMAGALFSCRRQLHAIQPD